MTTQQKTRVLFFAWGDSIHARRRINVFTEDDNFEVGVISTFAYNFKNAQNYLLRNAQTNSFNKFDWQWWINIGKRILVRLLAMPLFVVSRVFCCSLSMNECITLLTDAFLVLRYTKKFKPDVIFLQTLLYPCYLAYLLPRRIPVVVTFWNGDVTWWAQWTGVERRFKKWLVTYGVNRAAAITVNSKSALEACHNYGAPANKVNLIRYPGVNLDLFYPVTDKSSARRQLHITHQRVVFCPRGLGSYLNSEIIIQAAAEVIKSFPDTLFIFLAGIASQEIKDSHLKLATELGIQNNIRLEAKVEWENMPIYYQAANVMVSISSNDSLPNCMLEAMACGIPVIMGDIAAIREQITHEQNGFLVPPEDASCLAKTIIRLFNDEQLINSFSQTNLVMIRNELDSRLTTRNVKQLITSIVNNTLSKT